MRLRLEKVKGKPGGSHGNNVFQSLCMVNRSVNTCNQRNNFINKGVVQTGERKTWTLFLKQYEADCEYPHGPFAHWPAPLQFFGWLKAAGSP